MKKTLLKTMILLCALVVGSSSAWADYETVATFSSANVVTGSGYGEYSNDDWSLTCGGNTASMGTNKNSASSKCKITSNYGTNASTSNIATAAISKNKLDNISQITFVYTSGSGNSGKIYFAYSTDGSTWNAIPLTTGTQGASIPAANTTMTVQFAEINSAYYAVILDKGDATAANFRFDNVTITFDKVVEIYTIAVSSNNDAYGTATLSGNVITATPADGYRVIAGNDGYTVTGGTASVTNNGDNTFTVNASTDCAITINFEATPTHNASFYVNGILLSESNVYEGSSISFPSNPSSVGGKEFMGWVTVEISGITNTAPSEYYTSGVMGTDDVNYYAVFATRTVTTEVVTKTYGFEEASDADWTINGPVRSNDRANTGSYSGKINTNNTYVIFNNKVKVSEFSFAFTRTSTNNNYNVYIETSTDNSNWTAAGTYQMNSFNSDGTFSTRTKTFDGTTDLYVRFHCYNTTAVRYVDDVTIKYNVVAEIFSDYCTNIPVPVTITSAKYATYCNATKALDFSETGIKVYTAVDKENSVRLNEITSGQVPANTPVVLFKADADGTAIDVPVIASADAVEGTNDLRVSTGTDVNYMYVLAMNPTIGFYPWAGTTPLSAGRVYLQGKASYGARTFIGFGEETNISNASVNATDNNNWYDLQGRRVDNPKKGMYIVNGKKVVVK